MTFQTAQNILQIPRENRTNIVINHLQCYISQQGFSHWILLKLAKLLVIVNANFQGEDHIFKDECQKVKWISVISWRKPGTAAGFSFFHLAKTFQVISRCYPGKKKHFPGYMANNFLHQKADAKGVLKSQVYKTWKKISQYNTGFLLNFLFCPGFLTFWDQFQATSGHGQILFKSPDFQGFQNPLETLQGVWLH